MSDYSHLYRNWAWLFLLPLLPLTLLEKPHLAPAFILIPILWCVRLMLMRRFTPTTPLNAPLWLLILMLAVSLWATYDIDRSIGKVTAVFFGIALLWMLIDTLTTPTRFILATTFFLMSGLGIALLSLIGTAWRAKLPLIGRAANFVATHQPDLPASIPRFNANQIAGVLLWLVPVAMALTFALLLPSAKTHLGRLTLPLRLAALPTAALLTLTFLLTQSRAGYIGLATACALMLILAAGRWRNWLLGLGLMALLGLGIYTAIIGPAQALSPLFDAAGVGDEIENSGDISTLESRVEIWSRAIYATQDFPFTGMGMNNFREVVHILYPLFLIPPTTDIAHAHNHLLHTAVELGLPGLIAYLAIWFAIAAMLRQIWHNLPHTLWRGFVIGASGSLAGYFIYGLFDAVALGAKPGFMLWFLFGLITAAHQLTTVIPPQTETTPAPQSDSAT